VTSDERDRARAAWGFTGGVNGQSPSSLTALRVVFENGVPSTFPGLRVVIEHDIFVSIRTGLGVMFSVVYGRF